MSKPVHLTDMLLQRTEGPSAERPAKAASPASFQERIKESQARLSGKDHSFFKKPGYRARAEAHEGPSVRETRPTRDNPARPESADRAPEAGAREDKVQGERISETRPAKESGKAAGRRAAGRKATTADKGAGTPEAEAPEVAGETAAWTPVERPAGLRDNAPAEGLNLDLFYVDDPIQDDSADSDALLAKLEELGLTATPDELQDPAFLAEMLWMIDALPMASPLFEGAAPGDAPLEVPSLEGALDASADHPAEGAQDTTEDPSVPDQISAALQSAPVSPVVLATPAAPVAPAAPVVPAAPVDPAAVSRPAADADWTSVPEPEREEVAVLIREKLGLLADKMQFRGSGIPEARPDGESQAAAPFIRAEAPVVPATPVAVPAADLSLSDPDRLRVLQGAVLTGPAREGLVLPEDPDADVNADATWDSETDAALPRAVLPEAGEGGKDAGESPSDLMGRNPQATSESPSLRDSAGLRDAAPSAFQAAMERVRASDTKAPVERPLPMPAALQEQTVLAQIARKMSAFGLRGTEEIRIQLEPEHLGRVRIAIEMRDGGLTARIAVENEAVRQTVDQNLAGLRETLENQGVKLQGLEVSVDQRPANLFNPDGSNARDFFERRGHAANEASPETEPAESAETDTGRRLGYNTLEYIA